MHKSRRVKITDLNPHITCVLCSGYLIEATTIIECLHSFCRTCIVKYLEHNKYCPICEVQVHKTKPLLNIRADQTLQDIVYKLVPGLFQNEMCRRKDFYLKHPDQKPPDLEGRGEITQFSHIYTADESISLSLEYYNNNISNENDNNDLETKKQEHGSRRYLRCPAAVSVAHLQKLIRAKYGLSNEHRVDILYKNDRLSEDFTLMDIAYIYLWRRKGPLDLTYRIFEVAKRIKLNDDTENQDIKTEPLDGTDRKVKNEWKEVQLQISENGIMSVTNIGEPKTPGSLANFEVKSELNLLNNKPIPELTPIEPKSEKPDEDAKVKVEKAKSAENAELEQGGKEARLGKHKLQDDTHDKGAKIMKPNNAKAPVPVKNVQQLSRNHPLKIHSQSINKNNLPITTTTTTTTITAATATTASVTVTKSSNAKVQLNSTSTSTLNMKTMQLKNQNTQITKTIVTPQKEPIAPTTVQSIVTQVVQSTPNTNTKILHNTTTAATAPANPPSQSTLKYTQAGQSADNTRVTKSDDSIQQNNNQKTPISSSSVVSTNNCIQSSKVGIVPKKSPVKIGAPMVYKTLRDPPKAWNPQISRQNLTKTTLYPSNNGASTSESKQRVETQSKPAKFFKMRNNVPRYLGNPASGVKPMYQVRDGDKSPPDAAKKSETKKPENKINNNDVKAKAPPEVDIKPKIEIKKQSIVKIDPKTLRPIVDKPVQDLLLNPSPSCAETSTAQAQPQPQPQIQPLPPPPPPPEIKINQSTVPIFNPLRNQKSQTSPKIDRRSPKSSSAAANSYMDAPKSPLERSSPKTSGKMTNSPTTTSKKDKLSLNFTPPNPFIPNLASPTLNPNAFLFSNYPSYDPRVMNNITYNPFSMYYSQSRLTYPGLASQNLPLSPNLMSTLNLEVNKNLRKNYEMLQCSSNSANMEKKTTTTYASTTSATTTTTTPTVAATTCTKKDEKTILEHKEKPKETVEGTVKNQELIKQTKITSKPQADAKQTTATNNKDKDETRLKTNEISNQLQKTNKEKELNTTNPKEVPLENKVKEKAESVDNKVELNTENKSKEKNDIVQIERIEKKNDESKTIILKTT